ncbi:glucose-6-phosphate isomerase [Porphyromonas gingivalis]|uniref:glucose-6-phosphate isomerase n=1 Tax=Porphyromonas gingivalis TaxID=837 RepID=UPI0003ACDEBC|nr:glucose-6-phosphate isomerase [Porphyromonas gingivalis]ATR96444.1 glucose-6-phosphate isomerase [Porphyromonas gingivalis]ERJ90895.1 glucose-6-phosphate isomerase [Porphyromonas gingivalis W4087]MCE8172859.1 glucose-6-phosphate isomerase [Porphyromonas gingivalis]MCE8174845.1 glucose-6-phosphate isomerase [Porphyromonas gingivalis]MCE8176598.1 glucose-6-phosphate isomerase [Porphyromonas gingivalis]
MERIRLDLSKTGSSVASYGETAEKFNALLDNGTGRGSDFLGWVHLPSSITEEELNAVEAAATILRERCDYVINVGIGGSYLGARAVIEALQNSFEAYRSDRENPVILYAGNNIGEDYLSELLQFLRDKRFGIIYISKSGTTTEPAIAFRLLKGLLESQVGREDARERIVAVTDSDKGALRRMADEEGYRSFVIPDNVGGRFSVLTPVGLLPVAVAGFDIRRLVRGAADMQAMTASDIPFSDNPALRYAAARNALYAEGKKIEILANFHPKMHYIGEWWKQLFGESEGKEEKGIFTATVDLTTDLHSMGQWMQEGERTIFETVISVENQDTCLTIPSDSADLDGLNFLAGKRVDEVNKMAELGTRLAHVDGGVPNIRIILPQLDAYYIGQLFYFFEKAVGVSGYMLGVNPFDQPGVEGYKNNMFALLNKPGYETESAAMAGRLKEC